MDRKGSSCIGLPGPRLLAPGPHALMLKDDILRLLRKSTSGFVSGGELAERFKISRTAIWKHIKALEREGYNIEAIPSKGYRLVTAPDTIILDEVRHGLKPMVIGRDILLLLPSIFPSIRVFSNDSALR